MKMAVNQTSITGRGIAPLSKIEVSGKQVAVKLAGSTTSAAGPADADSLQSRSPDPIFNKININFIANSPVINVSNMPNTGSFFERFIPEENVTVPVSPKSAPASDEVFFDLFSDKPTKYYIPRYRVATEIVTGSGEQFRVKLEKLPTGGGQLVLFLQKFPASALGSKATNAKDIDHLVEVSLNFEIQGITKSLPFQEVAFQPNGLLKAVLKVPELAELQQLYSALSNLNYKTKLIVRRKMGLAFPVYVPVPVKDLNPEKHRPVLVSKGQEDYIVNGKTFTRVKLSVKNRDIFPAELFKASPDLPPCGKNTNASQTWVNVYTDNGRRIYGFCALGQSSDLANLWVAFPKEVVPGKTCYIDLEDRRAGKRYVSNTIEFGTAPQSDSSVYTLSNEVLESELPFVFPVDVNPNIYKGMTNTGPATEANYVMFTDPDGHIYLQDGASPHSFLYFPDSFKLTRIDGTKRSPWLRVEYQVDKNGGTLAELSYHIAPYINFERLEGVCGWLRTKAGLPKEQKLEFSRFVFKPEQLTYKLMLPGQSNHTDRQAVFNSNGEIHDILSAMAIDDFQTVFRKLLSSDKLDNDLTGKVTITLNANTKVHCDVMIRFEDTVGDVLELNNDKAPKAGTNILPVTLQNAIESEVQVERATARVQVGDSSWPASIKGLNFPLRIKPGEALEFEVQPDNKTLSYPEKPVIICNWINMDIQSQEETAYDSIIDPYIRGTFKTEVTVHQQTSLQNASIKTVVVDFKNSETGPVELGSQVVFTPADPENTVKAVNLRLPIRDYVLGLPSSGSYWYRIKVSNGEREVEGPWREDTGALIITGNKLPALTE